MSSKYFKGNGDPPVHVSVISRRRDGSGEIVFRGAKASEQFVAYGGPDEFIKKIRLLLAHPVPFSVGGHSPGPAEEISRLILNKNLGLQDSYVQISWSAPNQWELRQMGNGVSIWDRAEDPHEFTNISFNPDLLR